MRPGLEEIKYIEDYFLDKLSKEQKREFEERLKSDAGFAKNVKLQKILVNRVTRLGIKHTVALSHRKHTQRNTFLFKRRPDKNFFKSFFTLIMVFVIAYLLLTNDTEAPENKPVIDSVETVVPDSVIFRQKLDSLADTVFCESGKSVSKGQAIATIGDSDGAYTAHLHLEMMKDTTLWFSGYGDTTGFLNPAKILPYHHKK